MKKKLLIIAGSIVAVILLFIAFLPTIMQSLGVHPDYDGPTYKVEGGLDVSMLPLVANSIPRNSASI